MEVSKVTQHFEHRWETLGFDKLDPIEQEYIGLFWLVSDVNNGGFDQYFFNSSGDLAQEAIKALKRLEDKETLAILEKAMSVIPQGWVADREERQNRCQPMWVDENSEYNLELEKCDSKFYSLERDYMNQITPQLAKHYGFL